MKTKYVEPNAYMSKEMKKAFDAGVKKDKAKKAKKAPPKKKGK